MGKARRKAEKAASAVLGAKPAAKKPPPSKKKAPGAQPAAPASPAKPDTSADVVPASKWRNKEKPLILCARGITFRYRHLMTDLMQLIPHHKTDSKLDTKHDWNAINEVAELKGATSVMFFEARKRTDLYLWLAKTPSGPSVRFLCSNVHTLAELKLSGNHLKGSRPVLSFDAAFDAQPHLQVIKELLQQVFVTPKGHQKSKPFFDHVVTFAWADNRVWIRNYQVVVALDKRQAKAEGVTLVEVGPRVTMQPIKVFAGSFRGKVLFENPEYINPNAVRSYEKRKAAGAYDRDVAKAAAQRGRRAANVVAPDELDDRRVFAPDKGRGGAEEGPGSDDEGLAVDFGEGGSDEDSEGMDDGGDEE